MSRPYQYPQGFDGGSPFDRPNPSGTQHPAQPQSFRTNVNRAKTKKWTEAPEYSYDGDDWGEMDEYDEYGGYDEPAPLPAPMEPRQIDHRATAGGSRSSTSPEASNVAQMYRQNSFNAGDERRTFSSGTPATRISPALQTENELHVGQSPTRPSEIVSVNVTAGAKLSKGPSSDETRHGWSGEGAEVHDQEPNELSPEVVANIYNSPHDDAASSGESAQHASSAMSWGSRRDFSQPSALPAPLRMRGSPSRQMGGEPQSTHPFPPRKSSLSQNAPPTLAPESTTVVSITQTIYSEPVAVGSDQELQAPISKPLPFIRPADIYKRMEEEREKEQRSSSSSRPSIPDFGVREQVSVGSLGTSAQQMQSQVQVDQFEGELEHKSTLSPVRERKSEQECDGFTVSNPILARAIGANIAHPVSTDSGDGVDMGTKNMQAEETPAAVVPRSSGPILPPVSRVSGFGTEFWPAASAAQLGADPAEEQSEQPHSLQQEFERDASMTRPHDSPAVPMHVQHQPPSDFRSVVHQAFDRRDDSSFPPTPVSSRPSQSSHLSRPESDSTSGISPIMSGIPGIATLPKSSTFNVITAGQLRPQAIPEEPLHEALSQTEQRATSDVPNQSEGEGSTAPDLQTLHGRHTDFRNSSNSATHSSMLQRLEPSTVPKSSELANVGLTERDLDPIKADYTPRLGIDTSLGARQSDLTFREADLASAINSSSADKVTGVGEAAKAAQTQFMKSRGSPELVQYQSSPVTSSPASRAGSPGKGRVRELASRFDEISDSRRGSEHTIRSRTSVSSWERSQEDSRLEGQRNPGSPESMRGVSPPKSSYTPKSLSALDERPSFRPRLPGEWVSYASTAVNPSDYSQNGERRLTPSPERGRSRQVAPETPRHNTSSINEDIDITPTTAKQQLEGKEFGQSPRSAMAAVAAAGQALAHSLMKSQGMSSPEEDSDSSSEAEDREPSEANIADSSDPNRHDHGEIYLQPLTFAKLPLSAVSSAAPTPPPKNTPKEGPRDRTSTYFSSEEHNSSDRAHLHSDQPRSFGGPLALRLSHDDSPRDMESDRLRKELVRSLSPYRAGASDQPERSSESGNRHWSEFRPGDNARESTFLPKEYDSYWAGDNDDVDQSPADQHAQVSNDFRSDKPVRSAPIPPQPQQDDIRSQQHANLAQIDSEPITGTVDSVGRESPDKRYSWDEEDDDENNIQTSELTVLPPAIRGNDPFPRLSPPTTRNEGLMPPILQYRMTGDSSEHESVHPRDLEPDDAITSVHEMDATEEHGVQGSVQVLSATDAIAPRESSDGSVEHASNHEEQLSEDALLRADRPDVNLGTPIVQPNSPSLSTAVSHPSTDILAARSRTPTSLHRPSSGQAASPNTRTTPARLHPFREILAIKSPTERIEKYNLTRDQFATLNTGLSDWIAATLAAHPEHSNLISIATARPATRIAALPGTIRVAGHKVSPSLTKGVKTRSPSAPQATQPYYQQYLESAATLSSSGPHSPTATASTASMQGGMASGFERGRSSSGQQGKGLLHSAGKAGKGLLAKGKSRFRGSVGGGGAAE